MTAPVPGLEILPIVAVALIDAERRVLVQQRPQGKSLAGLWEFPGGKIEPGETPEAALVRELYEELGIRVAHDMLDPVTFASAPLGEQHLLMLIFACRSWKGTPRPLHADALRWLGIDALYTLPMPPADVPIIALLDRLL